MTFALTNLAPESPDPAASDVAIRALRTRGGVGDLVRRVLGAEAPCIDGGHVRGPGRCATNFQAERKEELGTALLAPIKPRVRAAFHGWLSARTAAFLSREPEPADGTSAVPVHRETTHRSAFHGWLAGRESLTFQAERKEEFGTALLAPIKPRVRAAFHGWLSVRTAAFFSREPDPADGTSAIPVHRDTTHRSAFHGWLAERESSSFRSENAPDEDSPAAGYHVSVMPGETLGWMAAGPGSFVIDGTLGGGGHSERLLEAGAEVLGIDRDPEALAHARRRLARFGERFRTAEGNFADALEDPALLGGRKADGLLLDLGVSSRQLDAAERGFSFREEGPLDMRMGPQVELTAAHLVNEWPEAELVRILRAYGEEPRARRIAAAIVEARGHKPFETTTELADCIERRVPRNSRIHPATRSFQAIRIAVNDELGSLERALEASVDCLRPGGRLLVITFHSLEDRIVKRFLHERSKRWIDRPEWPEPRPNPRWQFHLPQRKALAPGEDEIRVNPRARSAKLRVAELLDPDPLRS